MKYFNKKTISTFVAVAVVGISVAACSGISTGPTGALGSEQAAQTQDNTNLITNQPVPVFNFSQARKTLIQAEMIEANSVNTTTFGLANNGNLAWWCKSVGMPVPADAQLTNPNQVIADPFNQVRNSGNPGSVIIPQPDPIGFYTGPTTGTYTTCVTDKGNQYLQYWEGYTDSVSGPATYDQTTHQVVMQGEPPSLPAPPPAQKQTPVNLPSPGNS